MDAGHDRDSAPDAGASSDGAIETVQEDPAEALDAIEAADEVAIWLGDFDDDGVADIAFAPHVAVDTQKARPRLGQRSLPLEEPDSELERGVFMLRPEGVEFALSAFRAGLDRTRGAMLGAFSAAELQGSFGVLRSAAASGLRRLAFCQFVPELLGDLGKAFARGEVGEAELQRLLEASLGADPGAPGDASLAARDNGEFAKCYAGPQTFLGCVGIQVAAVAEALCVDTLGVDRCDAVNRRNHCYQVPAPAAGQRCGAPTPGVELCRAEDNPNGCCNADFIFDTVFRADLRNQAPMALNPATGPIPARPTTIELDGSSWYVSDDLKLGLPRPDESPLLSALTGAVSCLGLGIDLPETRLTKNPVTVSVSATERCAYNVTQPGHVLEGEVQQCIEADQGGVTTRVVGTGMDTRLAYVNEQQGARIFADVVRGFQRRVEQALSRMRELGLRCDGNRVQGGCVAIDPRGGLVMMGGDGNCSAALGGETNADPHLRTFDGVRYDLQLAGEFVLSEPIAAGGAPTVQVRQEPIANDLCPHVAVNTAVATQVGAARVGVYTGDGEPRVMIDGEPAELSSAAPDLALAAGALRWERGGVSLAWADGGALHVRQSPWRAGAFLNVSLVPASAAAAGLRGLLGDGDGDAHNDFRQRDGTLLTEPLRFEQLRAFGDSYRITPEESLFDYAVGERAADFQRPELAGDPALADTLPLGLLEGAEQVCDETGVSDAELRRACILDVACSGLPSAGDWVRGAAPASRAAEVAYPARFAAAHCRTLSSPGFERVERIVIPADGSLVTGQAPLALGVPYVLRASGQVESGTSRADVEYVAATGAQPESDTCSGGVDVGLELMPVASRPRRTRWGTACASHAYSIAFVGRGEPLQLAYRGCGAGEAGELSLEVFAGSAAAGANLAMNGDFESWTGGSVGQFQTLAAGSTALPGWTVVAPIDYIEQHWQASSGVRSLDVNAVSNGEIAQQIATEIGAGYWVFFDLAGNVQSGVALKQLQVSAGEHAQTYTFDITGRSAQSMGWQSEAFFFTATSTETTLRFAGVTGGSGGPALDNVRVVAAPR